MYSLNEHYSTLSLETMRIHSARILYLARKQSNLTQKDISSFIGTSQSNYSKMERGILAPSAEEWAMFCLKLHIPMESIIKGYLDFMGSTTLNYNKAIGAIKVPLKYRKNSSFKIRYLWPIIQFCYKYYGEDAFNHYLEDKMLIDPILFYNMDHQLNYNFLFDLGEKLFSETSHKIEDFFKKDFTSKLSHGDLYFDYIKSKNPIDAIKMYLNNFSKYSCDFELIVREQNRSTLIIEKIPAKHVQQYSNAIAKIYRIFLCDYFMNYLQQMPSFFKDLHGETPTITIQEQSCCHQNSPSCLYKITVGL